MEISAQTISIIVGLVSLGSMGVTIVMSVKKPQFRSELIDAVFAEKFKNLESNTHQTTNELAKSIANLRDNHIHTIESKLDKHIQENQTFMLENAKWQSRIETLFEQLTKK